MSLNKKLNAELVSKINENKVQLIQSSTWSTTKQLQI